MKLNHLNHYAILFEKKFQDYYVLIWWEKVLSKFFSKTPLGLRSHYNKVDNLFLRKIDPVAICMGRQEKV